MDLAAEDTTPSLLTMPLVPMIFGLMIDVASAVIRLNVPEAAAVAEGGGL